MKIGIDCRLAGLRHAGIGRYIENLVKNLLDIDKQDTFVLFFSNTQQAEEVLGKKIHAKNLIVILTPIKHYSLAEQLLLPWHFLHQKLDLLHIPHFNAPVLYPKKKVVTIHDLLWHEQKGREVTTLHSWMYWIKYWGYAFVVRQAIHHAQAILVPAKTIQDTIRKYYPQTKTKIIVTSEGVAQQFLSHTQEKIPIQKQLVYTGSLYPHKNITVVLQALKKLPNFHLVLVGSRNVFQAKVRQYVQNQELQSQVTFAGYLTDSELVKLYQESYALVQPSLSEGFGLTGIEAMAVGLPVIASNIPIFQEIYQNAAVFFDPYSSKDFIRVIKKLDRKKQILLGKKIAKRYDWKTMAQQTLKTYHSS